MAEQLDTDNVDLLKERLKTMNRKRPKQLVVRVSEDELKQIKKNVKQSGKNQQQYIIDSLVNYRIENGNTKGTCQ